MCIPIIEYLDRCCSKPGQVSCGIQLINSSSNKVNLSNNTFIYKYQIIIIIIRFKTISQFRVSLNVRSDCYLCSRKVRRYLELVAMWDLETLMLPGILPYVSWLRRELILKNSIKNLPVFLWQNTAVLPFL